MFLDLVKGKGASEAGEKPLTWGVCTQTNPPS